MFYNLFLLGTAEIGSAVQSNEIKDNTIVHKILTSLRTRSSYNKQQVIGVQNVMQKVSLNFIQTSNGKF